MYYALVTLVDRLESSILVIVNKGRNQNMALPTNILFPFLFFPTKKKLLCNWKFKILTNKDPTLIDIVS